MLGAAAARAHLLARRPPRGVRLHAALGGDAALVGFEQLLLPQPDRLLDVELERRRIPPDDAMIADLGHVQPGRDRALAAGRALRARQRTLSSPKRGQPAGCAASGCRRRDSSG